MTNFSKTHFFMQLPNLHAIAEEAEGRRAARDTAGERTVLKCDGRIPDICALSAIEEDVLVGFAQALHVLGAGGLANRSRCQLSVSRRMNSERLMASVDTRLQPVTPWHS
jgi:hypothetical protein